MFTATPQTLDPRSSWIIWVLLHNSRSSAWSAASSPFYFWYLQFVLPKAAQDLLLNKTFPDSPGNLPLCFHNAPFNVDDSSPILCDLRILHCYGWLSCLSFPLDWNYISRLQVNSPKSSVPKTLPFGICKVILCFFKFFNLIFSIFILRGCSFSWWNCWIFTDIRCEL